MSNSLRIVFLGTPDFAVASLKALVENDFHVVGVVTTPDKPAGRGRKPQQSPVKQYALEAGLHLLQPEKLRSGSFINQLKALKADLQIVVAFRMLPREVWKMPPLGTFNLHASLLPQYRGAAPINWAVINGETETGVTTFFLRHEIDTGAVMYQERTPIDPDEDAGSVHDRLMEMGAKLVVKTAAQITAGTVDSQEQSALVHANTTLRSAPKIFKQDCRIDWNQPTTAIRNKIRGLSPYPAAWTIFEGEQQKEISFKLFKTREQQVGYHQPPGTIEIIENRLFIATGDGWIEVLELQQAGKKRMATANMLRGFDALKNWTAK